MNGDFEDVREGQPVAWSKYGGELSATTESYSGQWAVRFISTTSSTKWVHQVVSIDGDEWYAASVTARVEGPGEAFLRISWYTSSDGSGSALSHVDGDSTSASSWAVIGTGPIQAPHEARSARVRLMLRPASVVLTVAWFDDAWFKVTTERPTPEPASPTAEPTRSPGTSGSPTQKPPLATSTPSGAAVPRNSSTGPDDQSSHAGAGANTPGAGSVKLSEVLSDPDVEEASNDHEWVELYNSGPTAVELGGWRLGDARSLVTLPAYRLESGAYVVVAAAKAQLPEGVPVLRLRGRIGNGLNNSGDLVRLLTPEGNLADAVAYGDETSLWPSPPEAPVDGETLARTTFAADVPEAWTIALRPTPGEPNVFPQQETMATDPESTRGESISSSGAGASGTPDSKEVTVGRRSGTAITWVVVGAAAGASMASILPLVASPRRLKQVMRKVRRRAG